MNLDPWYKVAMPRPEVREGRSFNPDEFAIALEQVVAGTAPIRTSVQRGRPFGEENWVRRLAKRFGLESTLRPRGRPKGS